MKVKDCESLQHYEYIFVGCRKKIKQFNCSHYCKKYLLKHHLVLSHLFLNLSSPVFLIIGYTVLYASLVSLGVTFMAAFYWVIDWNYPMLQPPDSILQTPGMNFRPQPNIYTSLVYSIKGVSTTYYQHMDHLDSYLRCGYNSNKYSGLF